MTTTDARLRVYYKLTLWAWRLRRAKNYFELTEIYTCSWQKGLLVVTKAENISLLYTGFFSHVIKFSVHTIWLTVTAYTDKTVQTDTKLMRVDWFSFKIHVFQKGLLMLRRRHLHVFFFSSLLNGPCQANLVLIAYASSEGSGEPAHPCSPARTFAARSYKQ